MGWYERASTWAEEHRFGVDAVWAAVLGVPAVLLTAAIATSGGNGLLWYDHGNRNVVLWATALVTPLAWRRVRPVRATAAVALAAAGHVLVGGMPLLLPADIAILVALWSVTVYGPVWAHRTALAVALTGAGLLGLEVFIAGGISRVYLPSAVGVSTMGAVLALAVWSLGLVRRSRREMVDALRDRARRLEIERDQQATIATAAERSRIAREMHDIVAHSLSVVVAQADGGRYAAAADPAAAERALVVIAETGRAALADMRRLLGVLRSDDGSRDGIVGDAGTARAPRAPQPGMSASASPPAHDAPEAAPLVADPDDADLASLLDQARGAGMAVSFVRVGEPRRMPPGAGLTLHRICQEALTNVRKHGGPGVKVTVVVRWGTTSVELEVSDDGRGAAAADGPTGEPSGGYGLLGMRERAAMFGGQVTAGPRPGGGWRVRFTMPLPTR